MIEKINMEHVLLFFTHKYKGYWEKIFHAIVTKENINEKEVYEFCENTNAKEFITIVSQDYPEELKQIYKPPFSMYIKGNKKILTNPNKFTVFNFDLNYIDEDKFLDIYKDDLFIVDINDEEQILFLDKNKIKMAIISDKSFYKESIILRQIKNHNNFVMITELPSNTSRVINSFYFNRMLVGLSGNAINAKNDGYLPKQVIQICKNDNLNMISTNKNSKSKNIKVINSLYDVKRNLKSS